MVLSLTITRSTEMNNNTFVKVVGRVRDIYNNNGESVIVLAGPHFVGKPAIREHFNIRERDFQKDCRIVGKFVLGAEVMISGVIGKYVHNGQAKDCIMNVTKIERI